MLKYRGQYRVMYECDVRSRKPSEFTLIPCRIRKGANICRHNEDTLNVFIPGKQTVNRLLNEYPDIFRPFQMGDTEATLLFSESHMEKAAEILKPMIKGCNVSPRSKRNIRYIQNMGENARKTG